ncbi:MAG: Ig-like domain-containing protein [Omnitrophica WOR_2 bacterium]
MKKHLAFPFVLILSILFLALASSPAWAQSGAQVTLHLTKIVGYYSGFLSSQKQAQGLLQVSADGPANLTKVVFYIDGNTVMGEVTQAPFRLQFNSGSYSLGQHFLTAVGFTSDGVQLNSNTIDVKFVTAGEGLQVGLTILLPVIGLVLLAGLVTIGISSLSGRKMADLPLGAPRQYGISGGTICPRCGRPFALHPLSMHLSFVGKFERCPFCGRLGFFQRQSMEALHLAEQAERKDAQAGQAPEESEEERLRRELDSSRYHDA